MVNVHVQITLSFLSGSICKHAISCQQLISDIPLISLNQPVNYFYNGLMFVINKYKYKKIHINLLMLIMIFS